MFIFPFTDGVIDQQPSSSNQAQLSGSAFLQPLDLVAARPSGSGLSGPGGPSSGSSRKMYVI